MSLGHEHGLVLIGLAGPLDVVNLSLSSREGFLSLSPLGCSRVPFAIVATCCIADYIALAQAKVRNLMCRATRGHVLVARQPKKEFLCLGMCDVICNTKTSNSIGFV